MKSKVLIALFIATSSLFGVFAVMVSEGPPAGAQIVPVRVMVTNDEGAADGLVAKMLERGWEVTEMTAYDAEIASTDGLDIYDVIWLCATSDPISHHYMVMNGGPVYRFTEAGGVLVVSDLSPNGIWLDVAPGGSMAFASPIDGAAPLTITDPGHPLVSGSGTTGVALTEADLDPLNIGGSANFLNLWDEGPPSIIAENADGPVLAEYNFGEGVVLVCALTQPTDACTANMLGYVELLLSPAP